MCTIVHCSDEFFLSYHEVKKRKKNRKVDRGIEFYQFFISLLVAQ